MNLYHVQFDGQSWFIEAPDFATAIACWKARVAIEWGAEYDGSEQPTSVHLIHDEPVIRFRNPAEPAALPAEDGALEFLRRATNGSCIVSSGDLTALQIANAQACKRFYVEPGGGLGWAIMDTAPC